MYRTKSIIKSIDQYLANNNELPASQVAFLNQIKVDLSRSVSKEDIIKLLTELCKLITLSKIFDS